MRGSQILFYDGHCGTCHKFIRLILRSPHRERFFFYPLSQFPDSFANTCDSDGLALTGDSIVLVRNGIALQRSAAILAIASEMGSLWAILGIFRLIPRVIRDAAYKLFAKHRFRFFGRVAPENLCPLGSPEVRRLFPSRLPDGFHLFGQRNHFLSAQWNNLIFFNYEVPPELLLPHLPKGTELDLWQGKALCSLVAFDFRRTLVLGLSIPWHKDFEEVNLRFYVTYKAKVGETLEIRRGVVFVRELVPRFAIAAIAKVFYNENYKATPMSHECGPTSLSYSWKASEGICRFGVELKGAPQLAEEGSIDEFVTEHYWGYAAQRDGSTVEYEVEHPKWLLWKVSASSVTGPLASEYGKEFNRYFLNPVSVSVALGSPVRVFQGRKVK